MSRCSSRPIFMRGSAWSLVLVLAVVVAAFVVAPANSASAAGLEREDCVGGHGLVLLYTDSSRQVLVDVLTIVDAPSQHTYRWTDQYFSRWVLEVSVIGGVTGKPYLFQFASLNTSTRSAANTTAAHSMADWRVTEQDTNRIVSDSRNSQVRVFRDGNTIVTKNFGPSDHGFFLSGFLGLATSCTPVP